MIFPAMQLSAQTRKKESCKSLFLACLHSGSHNLILDQQFLPSLHKLSVSNPAEWWMKEGQYYEAFNKYTASELFLRSVFCGNQRLAPGLLLTPLNKCSQDQNHTTSNQGERYNLWIWAK